MWENCVNPYGEAAQSVDGFLKKSTTLRLLVRFAQRICTARQTQCRATNTVPATAVQPPAGGSTGLDQE